jgi:FtsP/CotA-like multicopper oxidase with cupredoxin domain
MRRGPVVALVALAALAGWLLAYWSEPRVAGADPPAAPKVRSAGHAHHLPPTKGSDTFQYAYPGEKRLPAESLTSAPAEAAGAGRELQVYDPTPPPPASRAVHEYELVIEENVAHEVAPGIKVPSWTFNGTVPGPVLRGREGERMRIKLVNKGTLPHTIHFHGIHPAEMDGVFELVPPGGSYTYEFIAQPYGVFPYHCHSMPSSQHIHNGLYGMMIIDPREGRPPRKELAMVMSAFDLDRDGEADFYAWNGKAFQYADHPIDLRQGEPVRMYVLNIFEEMMAPHIHGNMFQLIRSGTALRPHELTDVVSLGIAERAILEFQYDYPGAYMFQCHFSEHMELGLMGWFRVREGKKTAAAAPAGHAAHGAEKK